MALVPVFPEFSPTHHYIEDYLMRKSADTNLLKQTVKVDMNDISRDAIKQNVFAVSVTEARTKRIE